MFHHVTCHEGTVGVEVLMYLYLTSALCEGGGQSHGRLIPGKEAQCSFYRRLGGSHGRFGRLWKISSPLEMNPGGATL